MTPETQRIIELCKQAVAEAIERHRRLGQSIVVWRDGQVVTIEAEDIPPLVQSKIGAPSGSNPKSKIE